MARSRWHAADEENQKTRTKRRYISLCIIWTETERYFPSVHVRRESAEQRGKCGFDHPSGQYQGQAKKGTGRMPGHQGAEERRDKLRKAAGSCK